MARLNIGEVEAVAGRTEDFEWSAYEGDGRTPVEFASDDKVRFKLGDSESDNAPTLDLVSGTPTLAGSSVSITSLGSAGSSPATGRVRLAQGDTTTLTGKKYWELLLVDNSETSPADACKVICRGTMLFRGSQGGSVGL